MEHALEMDMNCTMMMMKMQMTFYDDHDFTLWLDE